MDLSKNMVQPNRFISYTPRKRKRGRPVISESQNQQVQPSFTTIDDNLIGQRICGVVEGSFDKGYFLNVKIKDTGKQLQGVFIPENVTPVTQAVPQVKMYARNDIPIPFLNQHTPDKEQKKATWKLPDNAFERTIQQAITSSLEVLQKRKNLIRTEQQRSPRHAEPCGHDRTVNTLASPTYIVPEELPLRLGYETTNGTDIANVRHQSLLDNRLIGDEGDSSMVQMLNLTTNETNIPVDSQVKDVGGLSTEEKLSLQRVLDSEHKDQMLRFMLMFANDGKSKEYHTAKKPEDSIIELFPAFRRGLQKIIKSSFDEILNEEKLKQTEQQRSPMHVEPCGHDLSGELSEDIVPKELQLRLWPVGNQTMSGVGNANGGDRRSPMHVEPCGHDLNEKFSEDIVPEELQLRLWPVENLIMSCAGNENGGHIRSPMHVEPCGHDLNVKLSEDIVPENLQLGN